PRAAGPVQKLWRTARGARRHAYGHARRAQGDHRAQRRRQDDSVQSDYWNPPGYFRTSHVVRSGRDEVAEPSPHGVGNGAHIPNHQPVPEAHGSRQRALGNSRPAAVEICDVALSLLVSRVVRQGLWPLGTRTIPGPKGYRGSLPVARRAAAARDRDWSRQRPADSAVG